MDSLRRWLSSRPSVRLVVAAMRGRPHGSKGATRSSGRPERSGTAMPSRCADARELPRAYMTCRLGSDVYGLDVRHVRTVVSSHERVKFSRGETFRETQRVNPMAVPILDLRAAVGEVGRTGAIIVVEAAGRALGLVFDAALDVLPLASGQFFRATESTDAIDQRNILGRARLDGRDNVVVLVDTERLLADSDEESHSGFLNSRW